MTENLFQGDGNTGLASPLFPIMKRLSALGSAIALAGVLTGGVRAQSATELIVPSAESPTLRDAVAAAADGAVIRMLPGVYEVTSPVVISQKRITIRGGGADGPDRTELVGSRLSALLEFRDAGGVVQDIALRGSGAGIVGHETQRTSRGRSVGQRMTLRRVSLRGMGTGVLWRSTGRLTVNQVALEEIAGSAIALAPQGVVAAGSKLKFAIQNSSFTSIGNAAVSYVDDPASTCDADHIVKDIIVHMSGPGVLAVRSGVCVLDSKLALTKLGAVIAVQSAVHVANTVIMNPQADNGQFGDGVIAAADAGGPSSVTVSNTVIRDADRAGVSNFGSHVTLAGTGIACGGFFIEGEHHFGMPFTFDTDTPDTNRCSCPAPYGSPIPPGQCTAVSAGLAPPGPIVP
jgi:hypothetical protein